MDKTLSPMTEKRQILLVDDEEIIRDVITELLEGAGYQVVAAKDFEEGLRLIQNQHFGLAILDMMLPKRSGLELFEEIRRVSPETVAIMITAYGSIESAVKATKLGAFDFVTKPFQNEELLLAVKNGLEKHRLEKENRSLREAVEMRTCFENIIGQSRPIRKVFELIRQVSASRATVMIVGESGTGKELVAKAIHNCSSRRDRAFVALHSGAIPPDLLESELFGHVKGAFTGAIGEKKGLIEVAEGGTLFLDEVSTIPLETQAKLLRVLQEREIRRVGGLENIQVDVRIIAASNSNLREAVEERWFREDLFYRLNVINLTIPPLRERREDIPLLVEHFVERFCKENDRDPVLVEPEFLKQLVVYDWPGNVRELENLIERAVVLGSQKGSLSLRELPPEFATSKFAVASRHFPAENGSTLKERVLDFERSLIRSALDETDWNQKRAAALLKVNATTLNEKLKRLKIRNPQH